jgi:anti-anti-sigma factor
MSASSLHPPPKVERRGDVTIITMAGGKRDLDDMVAAELDGRTDGPAGRHLLLDFANVRFISSVELGTLIGLHKKLAACGGRLTLFNVSERVYEVLFVTRLHTLLTICREEPVPAPLRTRDE